MNDRFRIWGVELSPYSVKVRSYFRYKGLAHEWIVRGPAEQAESQKYARLPLVPIVATPEGEGLQDSTPILETIEARHPEPSIHPPEPTAAFVSALLEEFGDEWGNKWMFHFRWARDVDQQSAAARLAAVTAPDAAEDQRAGIARAVRERMVDRVWFVGSSPGTAPQIEKSFEDAIRLIERCLEGRPYLFGGRPAFADFGLWGQIYNTWTDPTGGALIERGHPNLVAWVQRMLDPKAEGDFEPWAALEPGLSPLLETQVAGLFLPWSVANAEAIAAGAEEFRVELASGSWTQKPQKYHARSLQALRRRYEAVPDRADLDALLERTGCLRFLRESK